MSDSKNAQRIMKELRLLNNGLMTTKAKTLGEDLEVIYDYYKEGEIEENELKTAFKSCVEHIENIEFKNMLSSEVMK